MNNAEYILCAAILREEAREPNCYYNNDLHRIELGYRHHDILIRFKGEVSRKIKDQGFYTSKGRFVDREEAMQIAKLADQVEESNTNTILYSEDLY